MIAPIISSDFPRGLYNGIGIDSSSGSSGSSSSSCKSRRQCQQPWQPQRQLHRRRSVGTGAGALRDRSGVRAGHTAYNSRIIERWLLLPTSESRLLSSASDRRIAVAEFASGRVSRRNINLLYLLALSATNRQRVGANRLAGCDFQLQ